ncbi:hypothetical protein HPG69_007517 [Diceros bicornis minor]|uniref:Uncharacterized protein n=1 Tax=Diceros bicornis minor TaxID=77932 RepID=A0A7J7EWA9_DICBM|nr:hypothetical protein HPG69_007517 [Diceros bicornis minor]
MQHQWMQDQKADRWSCILSNEPLGPGGQGMGQGHPTRPGTGHRAAGWRQKGEHRWTAEDPGLLQISINSFLDQLSLVMRNIRRIGAIFPLSLGRGKGG